MNPLRLCLLSALGCAVVATLAPRAGAAPIDSYRFPAIYYTPGPGGSATGARPHVAEFTPRGPIEGTIGPVLSPAVRHVAESADGTLFVGAQGGIPSTLDPRTGALSPLGVGNDPELTDHPTGLTYDTRRNRLVVSTLGAQGFLLDYTAARGHFAQVTSLENRDIFSLTYSAEDDAFYALSGPNLLRYNHGGGLTSTIPLNVPIPSGSGVWQYQLIATGDRLALITSLLRDPLSPSRYSQFSYLIDPHTGDTLALGPIQVVPEPGAALLAGAAGLLLVRRRATR